MRGESSFDEEGADAREDFKDDFGLLTEEHLRLIEATCRDFYENTGYGIIGGGALAGLGDFAVIPGPHVKKPKGVRELTEFMMAHKLMPGYVHELFDMQLEIGLKNAALFHQAVGDRIQAIQISGTDFGLQRGPYMAIESYREFYQALPQADQRLGCTKTPAGKPSTTPAARSRRFFPTSQKRASTF